MSQVTQPCSHGIQVRVCNRISQVLGTQTGHMAICAFEYMTLNSMSLLHSAGNATKKALHQAAHRDESILYYEMKMIGHDRMGEQHYIRDANAFGEHLEHLGPDRWRE